MVLASLACTEFYPARLPTWSSSSEAGIDLETSVVNAA